MIRYKNTILNPKEVCYATLMGNSTIEVCFNNGREYRIGCKNKAEATALINDIEQATKYKFD